MRVFTDILLPAGNTCPMLGHVLGSDFHDDGSFSPASRHSPGQREHQPQDNHAENKYDHHLPGRRRSKHSPNQERIGDH